MTLAAPPAPITRVRDYARTTFAPRHRRVIAAFAEALFFDDSGAPFEPGRLEALADECDRFVSPASKTLRFGLKAFLEIIRWLPLFIVGKPAAFDDLALADRVKMLERMDRGAPPLPLFVVAYKTILAMLFFEDPKELAATGYPGSERKRWRLGVVAKTEGSEP